MTGMCRHASRVTCTQHTHTPPVQLSALCTSDGTLLQVKEAREAAREAAALIHQLHRFVAEQGSEGDWPAWASANLPYSGRLVNLCYLDCEQPSTPDASTNDVSVARCRSSCAQWLSGLCTCGSQTTVMCCA